jgi:hypothetical protein
MHFWVCISDFINVLGFSMLVNAMMSMIQDITSGGDIFFQV